MPKTVHCQYLLSDLRAEEIATPDFLFCSVFCVLDMVLFVSLDMQSYL